MWSPYTIPAFERYPTYWLSNNPIMDAVWKDGVGVTRTELERLEPGELPIRASTDVTYD